MQTCLKLLLTLQLWPSSASFFALSSWLLAGCYWQLPARLQPPPCDLSFHPPLLQALLFLQVLLLAHLPTVLPSTLSLAGSSTFSCIFSPPSPFESCRCSFSFFSGNISLRSDPTGSLATPIYLQTLPLALLPSFLPLWLLKEMREERRKGTTKSNGNSSLPILNQMETQFQISKGSSSNTKSI